MADELDDMGWTVAVVRVGNHQQLVAWTFPPSKGGAEVKIKKRRWTGWRIIGWTLAIAGGILIVVYSAVFWWLNPELTQMQLFQRNRLWLLAGCVMEMVGYAIVRHEGDW